MKKIILVLVILGIGYAIYSFFFSQSREVRILVFSKTESFRHESIPDGKRALQDLARSEGWTIDTTENASVFEETQLQNYNVIVFLSTTGDVLDDAQQLELNRWIQAGGGFVGIHAAADTEYDWPWYNELVGAWFDSHPNNPNVREAQIVRLDSTHASTSHLPDRWTKMDEWYNYKSIQPGLNVVLNLDESTYEGGTNGPNHPIAWYRDFDGGRSFYTGLGHTSETFEDPLFLEHLKGGIDWAAGPGQPVDYNNANVAPEENRFRKVVLDFNLNEPMELDLLPNGDILFVERHGALKLFKSGAEKSETVATLEVFSELEDGLLGIAVDPDFDQNNWIYLYYSQPGDEHVQNLSRFNFVNDQLDLDSEKVLLQVPTQREQCCHSAGSIEFGPNGYLFLSTGDNTSPRESDGYTPIDERDGRSPWDAQKSSSNTNDLRGAILRIKPEADGTYSIPDGNLFPKDGSAGRPEIYVKGNRNPFRIAIDQRTGDLWWGEVGPDAGKDSVDRGPMGYDEINRATEAGFYGWPYFVADNKPYKYYDFASETPGAYYDTQTPKNTSPNNTGSEVLPPAQPAFIWYPYGESEEFPLVGSGGRNAMAGPVYYYDDFPENERKYPKYYDGKFFAYDWMRGWIMAITLDEQGNFKRMEKFLPSMDLNNPMDIVLSPQGDFYMLEYGTNWFTQNIDARLVHVEYTASNRQPLAKITLSKSIGGIPMEVTLSGTSSIDFDGDPLAYEWFVDDMVLGSEPEIVHRFSEPGEYTVRLRVTDTEGEFHETSSRIIAGNELPEVTWSLAGNTQFYFDNSSIDYEVSVADKEDGTVGDGIDATAVYVSVDYLPQGKDITEVSQGHESLKERSAFIVGKALIEGSDCKSCHQVDQKSVGPTYKEIASKYSGQEATDPLAKKIIEGGGGVWGDAPMAAHPQVSIQEARQMVMYIMSLDASNIQTGLPLAGTIALDKHRPEDLEGTYILSATYTDRGANGLEPLTQRGIRTLRFPFMWAKDFTQGENTMLFDVSAEDVPGFDEDVTILVGLHETIVEYHDIDFTDVKKMIAKVAVVPQVTAGGTLHFYMDSMEGDPFASVTAETSLTQLGPRDLEITIPDVSGPHTLIVEVISAEEGSPFGAIISYSFSN